MNYATEIYLDYLKKCKEIDELSIGHSIIAKASLVGIKEAVRQMLKLMER